MEDTNSDSMLSSKNCEDRLDISGFYDLDNLSRAKQSFSLSDFASPDESDTESERYDKITDGSTSSSSGKSTTGGGSGGSGGSGGKSRYKHVPHREKPVQVVARRNARERRRVQTVNSAFTRLRKHIPYENRHKRLSKVKTLRIAIDYIKQLQEMLGKHDSVLNGLLGSSQLTAEMLQHANPDQGNAPSSGQTVQVQSIQSINQPTATTIANVDGMTSQLPIDNFASNLFAGSGNFLDLMTSPNLPLAGSGVDAEWGAASAEIQELLQLPE